MRIFEWDEHKNFTNKLKHDISFEEAIAVFEDTQAVTIYDEEHSEEEERFIVIGFDVKARTLTVCHCYRGKDKEITRIISARKATRFEIEIYKEENGII
ncbi:MAG: BrnT family toxin [Oscillospiraceae bacterium]|nr:BrnT family toxin [Oscillospiraceae bacterium]